MDPVFGRGNNRRDYDGNCEAFAILELGVAAIDFWKRVLDAIALQVWLLRSLVVYRRSARLCSSLPALLCALVS